jgi:hypothetical protein
MSQNKKKKKKKEAGRIIGIMSHQTLTQLHTVSVHYNPQIANYQHRKHERLASGL